MKLLVLSAVLVLTSCNCATGKAAADDRVSIKFGDDSEDARIWACYREETGNGLVCLEMRRFIHHAQEQGLIECDSKDTEL